MRPLYEIQQSAVAEGPQKGQFFQSGERGAAVDGGTYTYVQFLEAASTGDVLADVDHHGLVGQAGAVALTSASAVKSRSLVATGKFTSNYLVGALGLITEGPGTGQSFVIVEKKSDDEVRIMLKRDASGVKPVKDYGWRVALTTSSKFRLSAPGRVKKATSDLRQVLRGILEIYDVESTDVGSWGWVRQEGPTQAAYDVSSSSDISPGGYLMMSREASNAAGKVIGATNPFVDLGSTSVSGAVSIVNDGASTKYYGQPPIVGRSMFQLDGTQPTNDFLIPILSTIHNTFQSYARPTGPDSAVHRTRIS